MFVNKTISEILGLKNNYKDHFGVEIEIEHENRVKDPLPNVLAGVWGVEHDGSLRVNGLEYVLRKPEKIQTAKKAVAALGKHIDNTNKVLNSGRAGVHVHVNVGDLSVRQFVNMLCLYHIAEPVIINWCGEYRVGNLFCLRLKDAEYLTDRICHFLEREDASLLNTDFIRYSSINLKATAQYGSVEFRAMRSDGNWSDINTIIDVLSNIKNIARQADNPIQIVGEFSGAEKKGYIEDLLGEHKDKFNFYEGFENDVLDNVRLIQQYAYSKVW